MATRQGRHRILIFMRGRHFTYKLLYLLIKFLSVHIEPVSLNRNKKTTRQNKSVSVIVPSQYYNMVTDYPTVQYLYTTSPVKDNYAHRFRRATKITLRRSLPRLFTIRNGRYQQVGRRRVGVRLRRRLEAAHHVDDAPRLQVARLGRGGRALRQPLRGGRRPAHPANPAVGRQGVDTVPSEDNEPIIYSSNYISV